MNKQISPFQIPESLLLTSDLISQFLGALSRRTELTTEVASKTHAEDSSGSASLNNGLTLTWSSKI